MEMVLLRPVRTQQGSRKQYRYEALCGDQIRLLTLLPGQRDHEIRVRISREDVHDLLPNLKYEALSYAWGDPAKVKQITVVTRFGLSKSLLITENLHVALLALRRRDVTRTL